MEHRSATPRSATPRRCWHLLRPSLGAATWILICASLAFLMAAAGAPPETVWAPLLGAAGIVLLEVLHRRRGRPAGDAAETTFR